MVLAQRLPQVRVSEAPIGILRKMPMVVNARRTRLRDGAWTSTASASSSAVSGSSARRSAILRRAATWIDWTTKGPGQMKSMTLGMRSPFRLKGLTRALNYDPLPYRGELHRPALCQIVELRLVRWTRCVDLGW